MREQPPPPAELIVTEDPVTGAWTLTLQGHQIEIERAHGFVKIDGALHHAPFVQGLHDVHELAGEPLAQITHLLPTTPTSISSPRLHTAQQPTREKRPAGAAPIPLAPQGEASEQHTPKRRARTVRANTPTPLPRKDEPSAEEHEFTVLPTERAAAYLGLSPKTLETQRTRGGGPPFLKLGRRVVYRKADLDAWLAAKVRRSTSDPGAQ